MKYRLAKGVRLVAQEENGVLIRRYPLRTIRCNTSLWGLLRSAESNGQVVSSSPVMESLAEAGFLQRVWEKLEWPECPDISVIVPVRDREEELKRCLDSLQRLDYPREHVEIIVVDDGSSDDSAEVARQAGVVCISSGGVGRGPAAARNRAALVSRGDLLAFVDSDCTVSSGWLRELAAPFVKLDTAAVGGCVRGYFTHSRLDRYEGAMSSLALGNKEQWGGPGNDSFYLPSCNLLVRKEYFLTLQGFDEKLRVGEDVDLSYRLRDNGYRIAYIPFGEVFHAHRNRIFSFMSRRFAYGTSEALLQEKHTERHKKMQMSVFSLATFLLLPSIFIAPIFGALFMLLLLLVDVSWQCLRMFRINRWLPVGKITLARCRTIFSLGYYISYHVVRYYLPILIGLSVLDLSVAAFASLIFFWSAGVDYVVKRVDLDFPSFSFIYFLEQFSYSCGVFWGCLQRSRFTSYRVSIQFSPVLKTERKQPLAAQE